MGVPLVKLFMLLACLEGIHAACDYYQEVAVGLFYDIKSPNYPRRYPRRTNCRWRAVARPGNILKLSCGIFDVPATRNCRTDYVSITLTDNNNRTDVSRYCGRNAFIQTSVNEYLTMELHSSRLSRGGSFLCNITAIAPKRECDCGWKKKNRIVGGRETEVNEYPFMAGLVDLGRRQLICGGSIISKFFVLTAAHCIIGNEGKRNLTVLVGDHDISTGEDTSASRLYPVTELRTHEEYDRSTNENDIGLLKVDGPIIMSEEVMPVCLPFRYIRTNFTGQTVTITGWGATRVGSQPSKVLRAVDVEVLSQSDCARDLDTEITTNQICTSGRTKDACQYDSGGPVLWENRDSGRMIQTGIVSQGKSCGFRPGQNMRVTYYINWIIRNTPGAHYCNV